MLFYAAHGSMKYLAFFEIEKAAVCHQCYLIPALQTFRNCAMKSWGASFFASERGQALKEEKWESRSVMKLLSEMMAGVSPYSSLERPLPS